MARLRLGGSGVGLDGEQLVWSVAEGARGGRWREVASLGGAVRRSVLLEISPAGRVTRLELATAAGLLTLHPEPDESALHGNVVTTDGIRHVALAWSPDHHLLVLASPAAAAVIVRAVAGTQPVGDEVPIDVVCVDDELRPWSGAWMLGFVGPDGWSIAPASAPDRRIALRLDADGLPILGRPETWPLELDGG